jgi:hypothetical protein
MDIRMKFTKTIVTSAALIACVAVTNASTRGFGFFNGGETKDNTSAGSSEWLYNETINNMSNHKIYLCKADSVSYNPTSLKDVKPSMKSCRGIEPGARSYWLFGDGYNMETYVITSDLYHEILDDNSKLLEMESKGLVIQEFGVDSKNRVAIYNSYGEGDKSFTGDITIRSTESGDDYVKNEKIYKDDKDAFVHTYPAGLVYEKYMPSRSMDISTISITINSVPE